MNIRRLPLEKTFQGMKLIQLERTETAAIYKMISKFEGKEYLVAYEVIKIKTKKLSENSLIDRSLINQGYTHTEIYPSSEQFGSYGWSIKNLETAYKKYREL